MTSERLAELRRELCEDEAVRPKWVSVPCADLAWLLGVAEAVCDGQDVDTATTDFAEAAENAKDCPLFAARMFRRISFALRGQSQ